MTDPNTENLPSKADPFNIPSLYKYLRVVDVVDAILLDELAHGGTHDVGVGGVELDAAHGLVAGRRDGRVVLRFGVDPSSRAEEDESARRALAAVARHLEETVCEVAPASAVVLSCGAGGRFRPIPPSRPRA